MAALEAVAGEQTLADWTKAGDHAPLAFQRTAVARDVGALLDGWQRLPAGWSAVTPEGDLADGRGVIVLRGRADPPGGASVRAHARRRDLAAAVGRMENEARAIQADAHATTERLRAARDAHLAAREATDEADATLRRLRAEGAAADDAVSRLTERLAQLDADLAAAPAPAGGGPTVPPPRLGALQEAAGRARALRDERARARDAAREAWNVTRGEAETLETRVAGRRRDRSLREARVAQLSAALPERRASVERLTAERNELEAATTAARAGDTDAAETQARAEAERTARRSELLELERDQGGGGARLGELEREAQATAIEASRRDEALAALARERELALEGLPETSVEAPLDEIAALDDEALDGEVRRVRRTLAQIGSVNPFAVEEHREVATRLEEMSGQDADLRGAIESTEELIARLDAEIEELFDAAFRAIGEKFDEFCRLLFAGGSASLQRSDETDGDAAGGIEIVVRPPGKRLQRLAMLSGGERALTGVALLFAMLTVNPVPFCILDEVDAALDEANIGRFAEALRKLSESIDFVVITHNRATIEVADTIYGVTMTDSAVSRVLSLRLADVPVEVGA
jgi:chromosome segregation protein